MTLNTVIKRDNSEVPFDIEKINISIRRAIEEQDITIKKDINNRVTPISNKVLSLLDDASIGTKVDIDLIQELVLEAIGSVDGDTKLVILYSNYMNERKISRNIKSAEITKLLTDQFISDYKHRETPMTNLGLFVYYRTYSRWLDSEQRREYWWETVRRAVEYNCSLIPGISREEAETLYDNVFNLRQFLSSRTLWTGGTYAAERNGLSNFNCSFTCIDRLDSFTDIFHILMVGSGAGFRVLERDVVQLPKFRQNINLVHKQYMPVYILSRAEFTDVTFNSSGTEVTITIGDSKNGWESGLKYYLDILTNPAFNSIETIIFDYNSVRPAGEKLVIFGGTASGHTNLRDMISKLHKVVNKTTTPGLLYKLRPLDCIDFCNIIAENVVSGGVRRSSEIGLIGVDDIESQHAKDDIYYIETKDAYGPGQHSWATNTDILHRRLSNNSIFYEEKPTREQLHHHVETMKRTGEPGFANAVAGKKRFADYAGGNPCFEILLESRGVCNLSEINCMAFVKYNDDGTTYLDHSGILEAQRLSARSGYRMTHIELELSAWDTIQKKNRLLGCSLTGWMDMVNALKYTTDQENKLLEELRDIATDAGIKMAHTYNTNEPKLTTTIKPSGTISLLPTVSPGVHYSHSPYYIRRVRISTTDPLFKVCQELHYPIFNEVGQTDENCNTKVIEFPVKAPEGVTKMDISALKQLDNYKRFQTHYTQHNTSITVTVRENEWADVEQWIWDNWDIFVGISFLSLDDNVYPLAPYEACTKEEFDKRNTVMKTFTPHLVNKYETGNDERELESSCEGGACPVR